MAKRRHTPEDPEHQIDLHGLKLEAALRKLSQELHLYRVKRVGQVLVITGRGWGNEGRSVLGPAVAKWLAGPEAGRLAVTGYSAAHKGGAFIVELGGSED